MTVSKKDVESIERQFKDLAESITEDFLEGSILGEVDRDRAAKQHERLQELDKEIRELISEIEAALGSLRGSVGAFPLEGKVRLEAEVRLRDEVLELTALMDKLNALLGNTRHLMEQVTVRSGIHRPMGMIATVRAVAKDLSIWIKRISQQLWQLLVRMMTPKEWKLGGTVGTGVLGLANVTVEITFGGP